MNGDYGKIYYFSWAMIGCFIFFYSAYNAYDFFTSEQVFTMIAMGVGLYMMSVGRSRM